MLLPLLLSLVACTVASDVAVDVVTTDVPTVLRVTWTDAEASTGEVAWQTDHGSWVTPATALGDGAFEALLVGARADTEVTVSASSDVATYASVTATTGKAVSDVTPVVLEQDGSLGHYLYTSVWPDAPDNQFVPVVLDEAGEPVWWYVDDQTELMATMRVRPDPSGDGVWFDRFGVLIAGQAIDEDNCILHVGWDGTELERVVLPEAHHDFWVEDDGTLVAFAFDVQTVGSETVYGDKLVRLPAGDRDAVEELWSTFDVLDPIATPGVESPTGLWSHANHLDRTDTGWLISLRDLSLVVHVLDDGGTAWMMGEEGDIQPEVPFREQHGSSMTEDGTVLVYDNASTAAVHLYELLPDPANGTAELVWSYAPEPPVSTDILGDLIRDESGDTFVVYGLLGRIEVLSPDLEITASLALEEPTMMGFLTLGDQLGDNEAQ